MEEKQYLDLSEYVSFDSVIHSKQVQDFLNKQISFNEQLHSFMKVNSQGCEDSFRIIDFLNQYQSLFLRGIYIKFYKKESIDIGFSFYIVEQFLNHKVVTFCAVAYDKNNFIEEKVVSDIQDIINKEGRLTITTTEKDYLFPTYMQFCKSKDYGTYKKVNNKYIFNFML